MNAQERVAGCILARKLTKAGFNAAKTLRLYVNPGCLCICSMFLSQLLSQTRVFDLLGRFGV